MRHEQHRFYGTHKTLSTESTLDRLANYQKYKTAFEGGHCFSLQRTACMRFALFRRSSPKFWPFPPVYAKIIPLCKCIRRMLANILVLTFMKFIKRLSASIPKSKRNQNAVPILGRHISIRIKFLISVFPTDGPAEK